MPSYCPSIYELMACPNFHWQHKPALEIWREKQNKDSDSHVVLESYTPLEEIDIFKEALSDNMVDYDGESIALPFNVEILKWAQETCKIMSAAKVPLGVKFYKVWECDCNTTSCLLYTTRILYQQIRSYMPLWEYFPLSGLWAYKTYEELAADYESGELAEIGSPTTGNPISGSSLNTLVFVVSC